MSALIKTFAKKSGKSEDEVRDALNTTQETVAADNPDINVNSKSFYKLVIGELVKMLSIKTENDGDNIGGIKYSDVSAGTTTPFAKYHKGRRLLKRTVNEAIDKLSSMSLNDAIAFDALQEQHQELSISMIETSISNNQLQESISNIKLGNNISVKNDDTLLYLNSVIKESVMDKQRFAIFSEQFAECITNGENLNTNAFEHPGYDIKYDNTFVSVKSSSTKNTVNEAYRSSNSIKTSALILAALYRMDINLYKEYVNFTDITKLLEIKEKILEFSKGSDANVGFMVNFINKENVFTMHLTNSISEHMLLKYCFNTIESAIGKNKSKFIMSYNKLVEFCGGDSVTSIQLLNDDDYSAIRENIIKSISNIKDYNLMRNIQMLLQ